MVDMKGRLLEVTVISARDLEDVRDFLMMHPFVVASLSGDERHKKEQETPVDEDGGTNPRGDHALADPFTVDVDAADRLTLKLEIWTRRTCKPKKHVGWVDVAVRELLEKGGDGKPKEMSYAVRLRSGKTRGVLKFSYKFGEAFTVQGAAPYQPQPNPQPPRPGRGGGCLGGSCFRGAMLVAAMSDMMPKDDGDDFDVET